MLSESYFGKGVCSKFAGNFIVVFHSIRSKIDRESQERSNNGEYSIYINMEHTSGMQTKLAKTILTLYPLFPVPVYFSVLTGYPPLWLSLIIAIIPVAVSFLADPPYRYSDAFRYPNINIHMWNSDWFYSIS